MPPLRVLLAYCVSVDEQSRNMSTLEKQQAGFRYEHKKLCAERALERCDYDAANIYFAQAAHYFRLIHGIEMTPQNRNLIDHETC